MPQVRAAGAKRAEVLIHEAIGENWYGNGLTSKKFASDLAALGELDEILVRINSPGGAVFDGISIYNTLKGHGAKIEVLVEGLAASAASFIAMAGSTIRIGKGAMFMIHNPWTAAVGDADDMRDVADLLDKVGESLIDIYQARTNLPRTDIRKIMDAETWLGADDAIAQGFADELASDAGSADNSADAHRARFQNLRTAFAQSAKDRPLKIAAALGSDPPRPNLNGATSTQRNRQEILAAETERRLKIRNMSASKMLANDAGRALVNSLLDDPEVDVETASARLLNFLGSEAVPIQSARYAAHQSRGTDFVSAAVDALCIRAGIAIANPHAGAQDLHNMSVQEIARTCLSQTGRTFERGLSGGRLVQAAMSTSDFPQILENALGKALRNGYETTEQSHRAWVRKTQVPDFKTQSRLLLGSAPALAVVIEAGEYTYGSLDENKTTLAVIKYGKMLRLTWETLVNDDLATFMRIPQAMGAAALRTEADRVYTDVFLANSAAGQTMQDGNPLFHSAHANISATVGAISTATLGAGRALLRKQQALGNGGYLNLTPKFLIVCAEDETAAEEVLAKSSRHIADTAASGVKKVDAPTPDWISKLQLVVEPRLVADNGFYLATSSDQVDTVELATLEELGGTPELSDATQSLDVDERDFKVKHVFVAKAIDWKGLVRVPKT